MIALALLLALAQDPFPKPGSDPTGVVVDEDGKPLAGARVELRRDPRHQDQWTLAVEQVLRTTPLPRAVSAKDGEFVLPLSRDQRRLGAAGEGRFYVHVEKEGHQRWCEPLPQGIAGYLGSRVILRRLREEDRVAIEVADPAPGMLLLLRRKLQGDVDPGVCVPVPADGKVSAALPLAPSPPVAGSLWPAVGLIGQVLLPGRSSAEIAIDPGRANAFARHAPQTSSIAFRRSDGQPLVNLRGLYRGPDGVERSFHAERDTLVEDPALRLVAVSANGCVTTRDVHAGTLRPAGEPTETPREDGRSGLIVRVAAGDQSMVAGASVRLPDDCLRLAEHARPPITDERGEVQIASVPKGSYELLVICEGFLPKKQVFDTSRSEYCDVNLERADELRVLTVDEKDRPVPFAALDEAAEPVRGLAPALRRWTSDSLGRVVVRAKAQVETSLRLESGQALVLVPNEINSAPFQRRSPCLVLVPFDTRITRCEVQDGTGGGASGGTEEGGTAAFLFPMLRADAEHVALAALDAPPFRVTAADLAQARDRRGDLVVLDRRTIARRIAFKVADVDMAKVRVVPVSNVLESMGVGPSCGNLLQKHAGGAWQLCMRDPSAMRCLVMHPERLVREIEVPARGADPVEDAPIATELERGVALTVTFRLDKAHEASAMPVIRVRDSNRAQVWTSMEPLRARGLAGQVITIEAPHAFAPGKHVLDFQFPGLSTRRTLTLVEGQPLVVDLTGTPPKK